MSEDADPGHTRTYRRSAGPLEVYAYHDWPSRPGVSPMYAGIKLGQLSHEWYLSAESRLRPWSGGKNR